MFAIVEEPIDVAALISTAQRPDCGAISTFLGTTRIDESEGASVEYLAYEAYRPMADRKLAEIGAEIKERWDVREVSIVHRLGRVEPGEASVAIVIAAPRRGPAFEASRYAIERIKELVPIWKREVWSDGYIWVGSQVGTREPSTEKQRFRGKMDFGIRVGAVVERGGALLLVRHQKPDRDPYWVLPGGRLEPGEKIPECAEREISEETGLSARFSGVLYVSEFLREGRHTVDITVRMTPVGNGEAELGSDPELEPGSEPTLRELRWVGVDELREIELLPTWIKDRLLEDATDGWIADEIYLEGDRG